MTNESNSDKQRLHAVFVQANTIKGYRYLDLSGVVLNRIADRYREFTIDPGGCIMRDPKDAKDPYAIRFSSDRIWLHYVPVESLKYVLDTAPEWISSIAKDIDVRRFGRLGLRCQFFAPCKDIVKASTVLSKKISGDILQNTIAEVDDRKDAVVEYHMRVPVGRFIAAIHVATIKIMREPRTAVDFQSDGLLFDVDIYLRREPPTDIPRAETKGFLASAIDQVYNLLERVGYNLLEGYDGTDN